MRSLFDALASESARERGMATAASNRRELLATARALAVEIARRREDRCVTADDVQRALVERGVGIHELGNAAGSLFKGKGWRATGRYVKSQRVHAHANRIAVWEWVGE